MEVGRRKKEEAVIAMVSAIKNVLTVLAVAIPLDFHTLGFFGVILLFVVGGIKWILECG
jgi:hypothetical protein